MRKQHRTSLRNIALTAFTCIFYLLVLYILYPSAGTAAIALSGVPVVALAWLFGAFSGLLSGLLVALLDVLFVIFARQSAQFSTADRVQLAVGSLALMLVGGAVGRLRDLSRLVSEELRRRQETENLLREERDRARAYLDTAEVIILALNPDRTVQMINRRGCELLGLSGGQIVGQNWMERFILPEDRKRLERVFELLLKGELDAAEYVENAVRTADGNTRLVAWHNALLRDALGHPVAILSSGTDITDQRRAQDQILRQSALFGAVNRIFQAVLDQGADTDIAAICLRAAQTLTHSQFGFLMECNQHGELRIVASNPPRLPRTSLPPTEMMVNAMVSKDFMHTLLKEGCSIVLNEGDWEAQQVRLPTREIGHPLIHSFLGVPLRQGGRVVGVLGLANKDGGYTPADQRDVEALSVALALALEHQRTEQALNAHVKKLEALRNIELKLSTELNLDHLLRLIVECAVELVNGEAGGLYLYRPEREVLEWAVAVGEGLVPTVGTTLQRGEGLSGRVWETGQPLTVENYSEWEGRAFNGHAWAAVAAVPIHWGERFLGVLVVLRGIPEQFHEDDLTTLVMLADRAAVALENARLYSAAAIRAERLAAINRIGRAISAVLELDALAEVVYHEISKTFETDAFFFALYDAERNELDFRLRVDGGIRVPPERQPLQPSLTALVITQRQPVLVRNLPQEEEYLAAARPWGTMRLPASWLGVPLSIGERIIGTISVQAYRPYAYTEEELLLLSIVADQVAVAVENARLFEQERRQRMSAEALAKTAATITSTLELDRVLDLILEQVAQALPADGVSILLLDGDKIRSARWLPPHTGVPGVVGTISIFDVPNLLQMWRTGEPVITSDTERDAKWVRVPGTEWVRSHLGVPIRSRECIVGFLNVGARTPGRFGAEDARLLQAFAQQAGIAIENAQLYEETLRYAEQLEQRVYERTAELEAQYARLETILSSITDGVFVTDASGEIIEMNPVANAWLNQALPANDAERLTDTIRKLAKRACEEPIAETKPKILLELQGLDLELEAAQLSGVRIGAARVVVAGHDVTHLKALERAKSQFASTVSHELRTPVTTIRLYADLIRRAPPDKLHTYLDALYEEAARQAQLVEDILEISRIDAGRLEIDRKYVNLTELVEIGVARLRPLAEERRIGLQYSPLPDPLIVAVDPQRFMQVLNNLVHNALQYTPSGGTVSVSIAQCRRDGRTWAAVSVADTGVGIPLEEQAHLFERFYRGQHARQNQIPGTGLGLAIAKEIVELHGGQITVDSTVGKGSTFTIWLPLGD